METHEVKKIIYRYVKEKLSAKFPDIFPLNEKGATNKIFWSNNKTESPKKPVVELSEVYRARLYKRFNPYRKNGKEYTPAQWRLTVKFEVRTASGDGNMAEAEKLATQIIDFIERLFTNTAETFNFFDMYGVVVNELEASSIRDLSRFMYTNNAYVFSLDIPFEYEDIEEAAVTYGQIAQIDIKVDDGINSIKTEVKSIERL